MTGSRRAICPPSARVAERAHARRVRIPITLVAPLVLVDAVEGAPAGTDAAADRRVPRNPLGLAPLAHLGSRVPVAGGDDLPRRERPALGDERRGRARRSRSGGDMDRLRVRPVAAFPPRP